MYIIGLSFGYHNSSIAVFENNKIIFAEQEERFTRVKNDNSFPNNCLQEALKLINDINKIECVVYYENPIKKFDRILKSNLSLKNFKPNLIFDALDHWYKNKKFFPENQIAKFLKYQQVKFFVLNIIYHMLPQLFFSFSVQKFVNCNIRWYRRVGNKYDFFGKR